MKKKIRQKRFGYLLINTFRGVYVAKIVKYCHLSPSENRASLTKVFSFLIEISNASTMSSIVEGRIVLTIFEKIVITYITLVEYIAIYIYTQLQQTSV